MKTYAAPIFDNKKSPFFNDLKAEVNQYFESNSIQTHGGWAIYSKAAILLGVYSGLYFYILSTSQWPWALAACALMGVFHAGIGFCVMHDAAHGSFSNHRWLNHLMSFSANLLGGNSFLWKVKHNIIHHTYTNIEGADQDIAQMPVLSLNSHQAKYSLTRYQHIYAWAVYALSLIIWVVGLDFHKYLRGKVGNFPIKNMTAADHWIFWLSKLGFIIVYIVIPSLIWGVGPTLLGLSVMLMVSGLILSVVFQLAHVVEETSFPLPDALTRKIPNEWAIHQLETTANFATDNALLTWYTGGLNYQVEHHLFPKISHIHYPALKAIVKQKAEDYGVPYHEFRNMGDALVSHYRHLKRVSVPTEELYALA